MKLFCSLKNSLFFWFFLKERFKLVLSKFRARFIFQTRNFAPKITIRFEERIQIVNKSSQKAEMDSRFKAFSDTNSSNGVTKRKYFDKQFKKHLVKALILNHGEPDNIEKVRG